MAVVCHPRTQVEDEGYHSSQSEAVTDDFQQLAQDLSDYVESSIGATLADIDHHVIEDMMREYVSNESQWRRYAIADHSLAYTRNLVGTPTDRHNLLVLVWSPGKASAIHDHANSHCVMKILQGSLEEIRYSWPSRKTQDVGIQEIQRTRVGCDEVTYMSDNLGLHEIRNPDPGQVAVSLHLYTPPNAAKHGCHVFDKKDGSMAHTGKCGFYSVNGERV